jgi:hypothetical protein
LQTSLHLSLSWSIADQRASYEYDREKAMTKAPKPRKPAKTKTETPPEEIGGPAGPDPVRYGDWERRGIAVDF